MPRYFVAFEIELRFSANSSETKLIKEVVVSAETVKEAEKIGEAMIPAMLQEFSPREEEEDGLTPDNVGVVVEEVETRLGNLERDGNFLRC